MGLRMYNVEFGDGFLLLGQAEHLLVDLGSIDRTVNFDPIRDDIRSLCGSAQLSLVLTHFHKDHWSGLRDQPAAHRLPAMRRVYLPDLFGLRVPGRQDAVAGSLLGELLESVVLDQKPEFTLAQLLRQVLPAAGGRVVLLRRGERFTADGTEYEVLWPRLKAKDITRRRRAAFRRFLDRLEGGVEAPEGEGIWRTVSDLADVLLRDFAEEMDLPRQLDLFPPQLPGYQLMMERVSRLAQRMRVVYTLGGRPFQEQMHYYAKALQEDWNRVSLVFQGCPPGGGILMTGDAPKGVLKEQAKGAYGPPYFLDGYQIIKAPHHGTGSHFCGSLPPCEFLCISNGTGNQHYQKISQDYETTYGVLGRRTTLRCTNDRCEFSAVGGHCPGAGLCGGAWIDI